MAIQCEGDCGWCKPSTIKRCKRYNKTWININNILYQCPYCKAVQYKSYRCKCCKKEVTE